MKYSIKIAIRYRIIFYILIITDDHKCTLHEIRCDVYNRTMLRVVCHYCPRGFCKVRQLELHDKCLFDVNDWSLNYTNKQQMYAQRLSLP